MNLRSRLLALVGFLTQDSSETGSWGDSPTCSTIPIVQASAEVLDRIFVQGVQYKRAGVIVMGISPNSPIQQDLFDVTGSETIVIGAQQYTRPNGKGRAEVFANSIKHDFKSKNPTTRWSDIIRLK